MHFIVTTFALSTHPTSVPRAAGRPAKMPDAVGAPHRGGADPVGGARRPGIAPIKHGFWLSWVEQRALPSVRRFVAEVLSPQGQTAARSSTMTALRGAAMAGLLRSTKSSTRSNEIWAWTATLRRLSTPRACNWACRPRAACPRRPTRAGEPWKDDSTTDPSRIYSRVT